MIPPVSEVINKVKEHRGACELVAVEQVVLIEHISALEGRIDQVEKLEKLCKAQQEILGEIAQKVRKFYAIR